MEKIDLSDRLEFPATLRNRDPICTVLSEYLPLNGVVLEIASGSGEHGVFFQTYFPSLIWQTSDPELLHRKSIISWTAYHGLSSKMPAPLDINVEKTPWPVTYKLKSLIKAIVCINMIHISPWSCTKALFEEGKKYLKKNNFLFLYGPFFVENKKTSESNMNFDLSLRFQNPAWGLRNLEEVSEIAFLNGFELVKIIDMPSNNFSVIYSLS